MANWLFYIIALVFYACCGFLELVAKWLGWTYTEACVYFNLYLQYGVLILSAFSVVFVAARMLFQGVTRRRWMVLALTMIYNVPFVWLGAFLHKRYGRMSCDAAFALCKDDLMALGSHLNIPDTLPYYTEGWTEYYIVNLILFVVLYLLALFLNWGAKRLIKKYA